jgi:three-Cys-motif partner protein
MAGTPKRALGERDTMNFHSKPFDEATQVKLSLYADYVREWLPVFLQRRNARITIVDLFAGPGRDTCGKEGSPLLVLKELRDYAGMIDQSCADVRLEFNEAAAAKAQSLSELMASQKIPESLCSWTVRSLPFDVAFDAVYPSLSDRHNLLFLDQQGMRFISDATFQRLTSLPSTDFMFFIASSSVRRFVDHPSFIRHLPIEKGAVSTRRFSDTHRAIADHYRGLLCDGSRFHLAQFSMKKGSNIYGLIFGSANLLGLEKFLRVCWSIDPQRGEANFDIDDDRISLDEPHLFPEMDRSKKVNAFQAKLRRDLVTGVLPTDGAVYRACLVEGMLPCHGREVLCNMMKAGDIRVTDGKRPRVSKAGYRQPRNLEHG